MTFLNIALSWCSISWIINHCLIHCKYSNVENRKNKVIKDLGEYISFLHSSSATLLSYMYITKLTLDDYKYPQTNKMEHNLILFSSVCYFTIDLFFVCIPLRLYRFIWHHISSLYILLYILYNGVNSNIIINLLFYAEYSVPFYVLWKYLDKNWQRFDKLVFISFVVYIFFFTKSRLLNLGDIFIMYMLFSPHSKYIILIPSLFIYGGSLLWIGVSIYRIYSKIKNIIYNNEKTWIISVN